ncbi:MAG: hypothetical protein RSF88_11695 [Lachnospiraceae bacterium]
MKTRMKKVVGLMLSAVILSSSTMGVFAEVPKRVANWSVGSYPGVPSNGTVFMLDGPGYSSCSITCNSYNSNNSSPVSFSSENFNHTVRIAGTGNVEANKRIVTMGNTYYVQYGADASGRTIANGQITG